MKKYVLVFACSAEEIGWDDSLGSTRELKQEVESLHDAIIADLAERFSEQQGLHVVLFETRDSRVDVTPPLPSKVERRTQMPGILQKRIQEGIREIMSGGEHPSTTVFLGSNPLYPIPLLARGFELLGQEDDVIVVGESIQQHHQPSPMWFAFKSYHSGIFERSDRWWQGGMPMLQALAEVQALVMTVKPVRDIASIDDLGYLFHEIEREVLLKQWYPVRTYEALHRMRRKHLIPETTG